MLDGADRLGLLLKAAAELRVDEELRLEHLDGDAPTDRLNLADEHLAHRAVAQRLDELVATGDDVARQKRTTRQHLQEVLRQRIDARAARDRGQARWLFAGRSGLGGEARLRV